MPATFHCLLSAAWAELIGPDKDLLKMHNSLYNKQDGVFGRHTWHKTEIGH